ncbi:MAG TPA: DUF4231 domain-containing protein [Alloacidobacterium sp.]|jgi:hypothetical protein|nr:DUF4231 domain-containing protein [Alloacidobacterium sp.]
MADPITASDDPVMERLEDQIAWYSQKSRSARRNFKAIKIVEILAAAFIPFLGSLPFAWLKPHLTLLTGALGVLITILEGILHLNQYQQNWTNYRSTAEALKHEKFLYLANAGPYAATTNVRSQLAERIESLVSQEHAQWTSIQQTVKTQGANP